MPIGCSGGEPDPAVAHDHGAHPVPTGWGDERVPRDLGVVVGVDVDEAGRQQQPVGVDAATSSANGSGWLDGRDRLAIHRNVGGPARRARAVHHEGVADRQVVHQPRIETWP